MPNSAPPIASEDESDERRAPAEKCEENVPAEAEAEGPDRKPSEKEPKFKILMMNPLLKNRTAQIQFRTREDFIPAAECKIADTFPAAALAVPEALSLANAVAPAFEA